MRPTSALLLAVCALSACEVGPGGPLAPGNNNGGIAIGGTGGTSSDVLSFAVEPSDGTAGQVLTPAIQVEVRDSLGTPDTAFAAVITIAIGSNPAGATLSGTTSAVPVNGVALFGDLSIDRPATGYTLRASATGVSSASSAAFTIVAP